MAICYLRTVELILSIKKNLRWFSSFPYLSLRVNELVADQSVHAYNDCKTCDHPLFFRPHWAHFLAFQKPAFSSGRQRYTDLWLCQNLWQKNFSFFLQNSAEAMNANKPPNNRLNAALDFNCSNALFQSGRKCIRSCPFQQNFFSKKITKRYLQAYTLV